MPITVQLIKRPSPREHLKRSFAHTFEIHTPGKIKHGAKGPIAATIGNQPHRLNTDIFQRAKPIDQRALGHVKPCLRAIHTRGDVGEIEPFAHLIKIDRQLICEMQITIHNPGHKLNRMIGLEPSGLIAHHRIGGRMGFVKAIVGEFIEQIPGRFGGFFIHPIVRRAGQKLGPFRVHRLLDFFAHGAAQQIGAPQRIARHLTRNFHHLLLVNNNALRLIQDMIDRRMQQLTLT